VTKRPNSLDPARIRSLHDDLLAAFGPQNWWPGRSAFEVLAGAILVQRTRWDNAAAALANLRRRGLLKASSLAACDRQELEAMIRPAGFYRQKAIRLQAASNWWVEEGGRRRLSRKPTHELRARLLALHGIGPETADCILLYVFHRPVFIADAYARRLFLRLGWTGSGDDRDYEAVAQAVHAVASEGAEFFNELHALIVVHGKSVCATTPRCYVCPFRLRCEFARRGSAVTGRRCCDH